MSRVLFFVDDFCWSKIAELFSQPGSATVWTTLTDLLPEPWKGSLVTILRSGLLALIPPLLARQRGRRLAATLIVVVCLLGLAVFPVQTGPTDQPVKEDWEKMNSYFEDYKKNQLLARKDFDAFLLTDKVPVPGDLSMRLRTSDEKHFCRAHEGMEEDKYDMIIGDLADYMKLDQYERKDLQNSKFMDSKVNVMEKYTEGHYAYLIYQILKTPAGKFDLTFCNSLNQF